MCRSQKIAEKIIKNRILRVQNHSRSATLTAIKSLSLVPVMISSMSVPRVRLILVVFTQLCYFYVTHKFNIFVPTLLNAQENVILQTHLKFIYNFAALILKAVLNLKCTKFFH